MSQPTLFKLTPLRSVALAALATWAALAPVDAGAVDAKASKYFEDALQRYEKKDLDGAIIQLKNALQIDKDMLTVQMLLGKALLQNGDVVAAEVALMQAMRLGVNRAEVVVPLAQALMAQGKQTQVLNQPLFNVADLPPGVQLQLWLLKAAAHADLGNAPAALKAVDEARRLDARAPAVWLAEIPIRIRARQFKEANAAAEQALALSPESSEAWYQKGAVAHVSGDLTATLSAYDRALKIEPAHVEARIARAGLYIDLARQPDAQADVDELRRQSPKEPRGAYLQALLAERNNQPEVARQALKDLVGLIDPVPMDFIRYRPQLLMLNGLAHYGLNEREKAKQYLEAFQLSQSNTPASKLLAQIHLSESRTDRAIEVLERYLKANPADGQAMTLLAGALMSKGQHARASSLMHQALQLTDAPEFRSVLGLSLIRGGQAAAGMAELEAAYKKDPRQTPAATALVGYYLRGRQNDKAVAMAESLINQQPGNAGFHNLLGMAKGQSGKLAESKAAFEQALRLNPALVSPKLNLARIDIATKAYDAAAARLTAILKADEKNTEAMFEMALLSDRRGQAADTQRWLEKATDLSGPKETRWGLALTDFHLRNGRAGPALETVKKMSVKAPEDLAVLLAYARAQLANGDMTGAKSNLNTATRVADYNAASQVQIAMLQLAAKNPGGAAYSLEKALSGQPDFLPAQALMTEVELRQGEPANAEKRARDILARHPKLALGHSLLGDIAQSRGQPTQAVEAYRRAYQTEPSTNTFMRLFGALANQDGGKAAIELAQQWTRLHPKDARAQKALANTYARSGQFALAKTSYEILVALTPDDSDALNNLANVLLRLKDPAAVKMAEQAVAKNPNDANAIDTLGWALFQAGQTERALQYLRDARLRQPGNPEIRYHLAVVLALTGRKAEAINELESALKDGQGFETATEAAALLKALK